MSRILVIDDEPSGRLILQKRLKDIGHDVLLVENGAQGLLEARKSCFDLFLVYNHLSSGVDGSEVCRRLKQTPETVGVPVILMSRQACSRDEVHRGYLAGCDSFLSKAELPNLEDVIRAMLRFKSARDDLASQTRALEEQARRADSGGPRASDIETALRERGEPALALRELPCGCPDGLLIVDPDGVVQVTDRGAHEILGNRIEGEHLGRLAPASGLEAFVRDARTESRDGFRFDLPPRNGRSGRSMIAAVVPLVSNPGERDPGLRILLLVDSAKRRVAAELLRIQESEVPRRELGVLVEAAQVTYGPAGLIGVSSLMAQIRSLVASMAARREPVVILGEPGTGKKHVARALHYTSLRSGSFIPVNCGAFSPENLAGEIFGQVKGGSSDALTDRPGVLQQAQHGTVLLESIEKLPGPVQERLLRFVHNGELSRVGSQRIERLTVRLVVSSTEDLDREVEAGRFSKELWEAISGLVLEIAPLRERREDVPPLVQHFLRRFGAAREHLEVDDEAMWVMESHDWRGNVRELETCMERACVSCTDELIEVSALPQVLRDLHAEMSHRELVPPPRPSRVSIGGTHTPLSTSGLVSVGSSGLSRAPRDYDISDEEPVSLALYEKKALLRALSETGGDKLAAARLLKVGKSTLYRKLKRFGIT